MFSVNDTGEKEKAPGFAKRYQEYLNVRERFNKYGAISFLSNKPSVHLKVFAILLRIGERKVAEYDNLRHLLADVIEIYIGTHMKHENFKSKRELIFLTLQLESSIGRSIRKIREDDAMNFHKKTYAKKSKKYEENADDHGDTAVEQLGELE